MENQEHYNDKLKEIIQAYQNGLVKYLELWWNNLELRADNKIVLEVIGGLYSRHVSLTYKFIDDSKLWNGELGSIFLRCVCENYITTAWILKQDVNERSEKFIAHGIGLMKLQYERTLDTVSKMKKPSEFNLKYLEFQKHSINNERNEFIVDVNVGAWADIGVRQMAIEAECKDFYDFVFSPFSESIHGTWSHLIKYNLLEESDPLAMNVKKPKLIIQSPNIHYLKLAIKYTDKFISLIEGKFEKKFTLSNPSIKFYSQLSEIEKSLVQ